MKPTQAITRTMAIFVFAAALLATFAPGAHANDHDLNGVSVKVENTIEAPAFGFDGEAPFGGMGPVQVNATVEFADPEVLYYTIDVTGNQISMTWVGPDNIERVIEEGTYDRYYFTFGEPLLAGATLNGASTLPANVRVTSPSTLTVEVGPGMQVGDAFFSIIDIAIVGDSAPAAELAFTGASTAQLAVIGATAVASGAGLVAWSRKVRRSDAATR